MTLAGKPSQRTGWLLDLYEDPLGGVVIWFLEEGGRRSRLSQRFPVVFYASGSTARLQALQAFIGGQEVSTRTWFTRRLDVFARCEVEALAVEVARPGDLGSLFQQVRRRFADLDYADADLQLSLRYAADSGVSPLMRCQVETDAAGRIQKMQPLEDPWAPDPSPLPLRVMTLVPDCDPACRAPTSLRVETAGRSCWLPLQPARVLLVTLQSLLKTSDPDLLVTDWGDTWLLPHLMELSEAHRIPLALNRDPDAQAARRKERWYFSYGQIIYRGEQVLLFGRQHIDRKNAMMWSEYELEGVLEMARVTALPLQTAARVSPGTGISAIQILAALRANILVPWQKPQAEMLKPALDLFAADQGGLVFQPILGVHYNVAALDFVSMYPAIIVRFKISPETLCPDARLEPGTRQVPGLKLGIDPQPGAIVAQALAPLLNKRVTLKRRGAALPSWDPRRARDKSRSSALKWLLVTCFGYLGYKNARFGRIEAHQAVTAYGREALLLAKEAAEETGGQILHAYVDSLFVRWDDAIKAGDLEALLSEIETRTSLPIALDGIYRWVAFLPSRASANRPVANRYFGVFENGEIKMRGIAARRRDTPSFIARVQIELVEILARAQDPAGELVAAEERLRIRLRQLATGRVKPADLMVTQRLTREPGDYRSPSPAARAAQQLQAAGKIVKPGQRVGFVYTLGKPGVHAWHLPHPPDPKTLDLTRYQTLLRRAAGEVLDPFLALRPSLPALWPGEFSTVPGALPG
jgi:DNA polymerase II